MAKKVVGFFIDLQNSFCWCGLPNVPGISLPSDAADYIPAEVMNQGELYVPGAYESAIRLAAMIKKDGNKFNDIYATLDTHHAYDIAHALFWKGDPPDFTIMTEDELEKGTWRPVNPNEMEYAKQYVSNLASNGRYPLCIWPAHCRIGTYGHNFVDPIKEAFLEWETNVKGFVECVTKGSNYRTEHYSAVKADVPDPDDPSTYMNDKLIGALDQNDLIVIAGQARSHCVANTVRDVASEFGSDSVKKIVLLEDAMDDVPGFEDLGEAFMDDMLSMGVQIKTTENLFG